MCTVKVTITQYKNNSLYYICQTLTDRYGRHYLKVECVWSTAAGVTVQIIAVFAFPPNDSCRIRVNLESRKFTNCLDNKKKKNTHIFINIYKK